MHSYAAGRGGDFIKRGAAQTKKNDAGAIPSKKFGRRPADAGRGAGVQRRAALQRVGHSAPHCRSTAKPVSGNVEPPSTTMVWPVTYFACSDARYSMAWAISSASPIRPTGM